MTIEKHQWTAHQEYHLNLSDCIFEYDPADDGPEVEIITRILAAHPALDPVLQARTTVRLKA